MDTGWPTAPNRSVKRKRLAPPRAPVYTDGGKTKPRDGKTCAETPSAVTVIFKDISGRSITYASRVRPFVFIPVVRPLVDVHYRNLREPTLSFAKRVRPFVMYIYTTSYRVPLLPTRRCHLFVRLIRFRTFLPDHFKYECFATSGPLSKRKPALPVADRVLLAVARRPISRPREIATRLPP